MARIKGEKKSDSLREQARRLMEQAAEAERAEMEELGREVHKVMKKTGDLLDTDTKKSGALYEAIRSLYPEWKPGK